MDEPTILRFLDTILTTRLKSWEVSFLSGSHEQPYSLTLIFEGGSAVVIDREEASGALRLTFRVEKE